MTTEVLNQHIRALGIAHVVYSILLLVPAGIVFFALTSIGYFSDDPQAMAILTTIGTIVSVVLTMLAIPGIIAGMAVLYKKSWGIPMAMIVGIFNLLSIPFGTALGIYSLWVFSENQRGKSDADESDS